MYKSVFFLSSNLCLNISKRIFSELYIFESGKTSLHSPSEVVQCSGLTVVLHCVYIKVICNTQLYSGL